MKKLLIGMLGLLLSTSLIAEEVLYCSPEFATGFYLENGKWGQTSFERKRFSVKVNNSFESVVIDDDFYNCHKPYEMAMPDTFVCNEKNGYSFRYSTKSKKFIRIYSGVSGYLSIFETIADQDVIFAGICEKF